MRHYSLWLDRYKSRRDQILRNLKAYKDEVNLIKKIISDKKLILPLNETSADITERMCFVDGGEGITELLGASVYFIRASGLILDKIGNTPKEEFIRDLDIDMIDYDEHTKERVEFLRSAMEFDVAMRCIEGYNPGYIFIDGSLYVNSGKRPVECSEYHLYRKKFSRLLKLCKNKEIHIVGVSEDSQSRLFINYLSMKYGIKFPRFMTDSSILRLISKNTKFRTIEFTPQPIFESDSPLTISFPTVYIQPTSLSNPLRIDVPDWEQDFNGIIDLIVKLSKGSKQYGYPLPLYLAHLDARIEEKQTEWSTKQIIHHISREDPELYDTILRERRRGFRPKS